VLDVYPVWALVLAAGEGKRLRSLTTPASGMPIPKQFCSLHEGPSLLHEALCRARSVTFDARICAVVAEQHRRWWEPVLWPLPATNIIAQPENRGTAYGILLPLLHIAERDPTARLLILPSDHFVRDDAVLAVSMREALERLRGSQDETVLLGLEPERCDPGLGYIIPGSGDGSGTLPVARFVEKPPALQARELIEHGALWNSFIIATTVQALLALFNRRIARHVIAMRTALRLDEHDPTAALAVAELYDRLAPLDFSRDILQGQEAHLRVLRVPPCGWTDLGTPERVACLLQARGPRRARSGRPSAAGQLSLAAQYNRMTVGTAIASATHA
jgi:mannose-1-phosphate guanylyltransferase